MVGGFRIIRLRIGNLLLGNLNERVALFNTREVEALSRSIARKEQNGMMSIKWQKKTHRIMLCDGFFLQMVILWVEFVIRVPKSTDQSASLWLDGG